MITTCTYKYLYSSTSTYCILKPETGEFESGTVSMSSTSDAASGIVNYILSKYVN